MPEFKDRMLTSHKDFKKNNRGVKPTRFILSEEDTLDFTEGDRAADDRFLLFGIPVVEGENTHIE